MKKFKRILALVLAVMTVVSTMSVGVFAAAATCPGEDVQHTLENCNSCTQLNVVAPETCADAGYILYECDTCGVEFKIVIPAKPHQMGEYTVKTPATCDEDGVEVAYCSVCNTDVERVIPKLGHVYREEMTVSPTETKEGTVVIDCTREGCDFEKVLTIAPTCDHAKTSVSETPATCTTEGKIAHLYCATCDIYVIVVEGEEVVVAEEDLFIEMLPHAYGEYTKDVSASTCTTLVEKAVCEICSHVDTRETETEATHTWDAVLNPYDVAVYAEFGAADGWFPVNAKGELINNPELGYPCGKDVVFMRVCDACGEVETKVVEAQGHIHGSVKFPLIDGSDDAVYESKVEAPADFCTEGGFYTITCALCGDYGKKVVEGEVTEGVAVGDDAEDANGVKIDYYHLWVEDHYNCEEPDCVNEGKHVYKCLVCKKTKVVEDKDIIPANGHDYVPVVKSENCKEEGYTQDVCSVCGDVKKDENGIEIKYNFTPVNPDKHSGTDGNPEFHVHKEATCTEDGYGSYYCAYCDKVDQTHVTIPAGHKWGDPVVVAPTCTTGGTSTVTCTVCGTPEVTPLEPTGHTPLFTYTDAANEVIDETTKVTDATCHSAATYTTTCAVCGAASGAKPYGNTVPCELDTSKSYELLREPTCTMVGYYYGTCKWAAEDDDVNKHVCALYFTIPTVDHDYTVVVPDTYVDPTCTTPGKNSDMECSMCGDVQEGAPIGTIAHNYVEIGTDKTAPDYDPENILNPIATPTCGQFARTYQVCSDCGLYDIVDGTFIDRLSQDGKHHSEKAPVVHTPATCTTEGKLYWNCKHCGVCLDIDPIEKTAHKHVITAADPANGVEEEAVEWFDCEELGKEVYTCDACSYGHVTVVDDTDGDCQTYPSYVTYCLSCGTVIKNEIKDYVNVDTWVFNHNYVKTVITEAFCANDGVAKFVCTGCGAYEQEAGEDKVEVIPAPEAEHDWNNGKITVRPTVTSGGTIVYTCKVCGATDEKDLPAYDYDLLFTYDVNHVTEKVDDEGNTVEIIDELNVVNNGLVAVTIKTVANEFDVYSIALRLNYDAEQLTFVEYDFKNAENFKDYDAVATVKKNAPSYVTIYTATAKPTAGVESYNTELNGEADYIVLYFRVNADVNGAEVVGLELDAINSVVSTADYTEYVDGVEVNGKTASFGADPATGLVAHAEVVRLGDVLQSTLRPGVVNAADLAKLVNIVISEDEALYVSEADINRDGYIDLADYALLKKYILDGDYAAMVK